MCLVFSGFTSSPTSLLKYNTNCVFPYDSLFMFSTNKFHNISISHNVACHSITILLYFWTFSAVFYKSQFKLLVVTYSISLFQTILNRECMRQMVQMIAIKRSIEHFRLSFSSFSQKEWSAVTLILCSCQSRALETNPTDLIFSEIFVAVPSRTQLEKTPYKLGTRHICTASLATK
jgi:hypothetical protein